MGIGLKGRQADRLLLDFLREDLGLTGTKRDAKRANAGPVP